ncbi:MAG: bL21 family ribosomal protein, partial [Clostridia bacterium]|nr:bL21 family ribosomal protein [Clostridia bacterium]
MFAVVRTGGKQYTVAPSDVIKVEKLPNNVGDKVELEVLLVSDESGVKTGKTLKAK